MRMPRSMGASLLALACVAVLAPVSAYTQVRPTWPTFRFPGLVNGLTAIRRHQPGELRKLLALRDEMMRPERGIAGYLASSWKCPTHRECACLPHHCC